MDSADAEERGLWWDTKLEGEGPGFSAVLNSDWDLLGPCGGYLAAIALRAAGVVSGRARPASISCIFSSVASFGLIDVSVNVLSNARRASAMAVTLSQEGRHVMEAHVWTIDDGLTGYEHDVAAMPDVPPPEAVESLEGLLPLDPSRPYRRFRQMVEERTMTFDFKRMRRPLGDPRILSWFRFHPQPVFQDPYVDAGRSLILCDTFQYPAARAMYEVIPAVLARSLDLVVHFHDVVPQQEWLLCEATSPCSGGGLLNGRSRIWAQTGRLVASGGQQMLCRPVPST